MAKASFLTSPFGEVSVEATPFFTRICAPETLAGDWALGWWHARAAGDQAVFARSFWSSQLAVGPRPAPVRAEVDAFTSRWGFTAVLDRETEGLPAGHRARVQAYTRGFNQGRHRRGQELPWTPEDSHLLVRSLGFLEWWESREPVRRFLQEAWKAGLPWDHIVDLYPEVGPTPPSEVHGGSALDPPLSAGAWDLIRQIRRFRGGSSLLFSGSRTTDHRPLLGVSYVNDVTEPGLPFLSVAIETPGRALRGLSRPGHPGFLAGQTGTLAWQAVPGIDDIMDLAPNPARWAGADQCGTLGALLALEDAGTVEQAESRTRDRGSATLDFTAVDLLGESARWAAGPRWNRPGPRDAWFPQASPSEAFPGHRAPPGAWVDPPFDPGKINAETVAGSLVRTRSRLPGELLPVLRFLLPDSEDGQRLRRWTGSPETGPEAQAFETLAGAAIGAFWETSPLVPPPGSVVFHALLPTVLDLLQAPHSAWMPSGTKNQRLAQAVRRAFGPGRTRERALLAATAPKACWTETSVGRPRIWAVTTAFCASPGEGPWKVFLTDDETEVPTFHQW
jgi:hypothetical protein